MAKNCIFDDANRLAARGGWEKLTTTPATGAPDFAVLFEYLNASGSSSIIAAGANKVFTGTTTFTDITGAVTPSASNWQFINFNGNCYGIQAGHTMIQYTGAGNIANFSPGAGTAPSGDCLLSAFGRVWGTNSTGQKLKYCSLLDITTWSGGTAGEFDLTNVWPTYDTIKALASFNNYLIVFGMRNIIIFEDGTGSSIGMNPTNMSVKDIIPGIGCIARDTVQNINGDDLVFLSQNGLMSLRRVIQEKSNPLRDISRNVRNYLLSTISLETLSAVRSTYNPKQGFYVLLCPATSRQFVFDTKFNIPDTGNVNTLTAVGAWRVTEWEGHSPTSILTLYDGATMYSGLDGNIYEYGSTYLDDTVGYNVEYTSGWLVVNEEVRDRIKFLKRISAIAVIGDDIQITFQWFFDFDDTGNSAQLTVSSPGGGMEWGSGEWGLGEWGAFSSLAEFEVPGTGSGQFIKLSLQVPVVGELFSLQQLQMFAKVGRIK